MRFQSDRDPANERPRLVDIWLEPFPVDVADRGDAFVLAAVLLGVDRDRIDVTASAQSVEISAGYAASENAETVRRRTITVPAAIEPSNVTATYEDGILELRLPKQASES